MPKRVQIALAVALIILAGVSAWQGLRLREPVYQGKRLSVWLREYRSGLNIGDEDRVRAGNTAKSAIRAIGTNAIPTLLNMLRKKDSFVVSKLVGLWNRHLYSSLPNSLPNWVRYPGWYMNQAATLNNEAVLGFKILGADAQQAVPALITIYEQGISPDSQAATGRALNAIGPVAQRMALPSCLRAAASPNSSVRGVAIQTLYAVHVEPQVVVPALVKALSDTNFVNRLVAARGLGSFGTNAQQAVPALMVLLSDSNSRVRSDATNALKKIDPEAAAKAGVK